LGILKCLKSLLSFALLLIALKLILSQMALKSKLPMIIKMNSFSFSNFSFGIERNFSLLYRLEWLGRKFVQKKIDYFLQGLNQVIYFTKSCFPNIKISGDTSRIIPSIHHRRTGDAVEWASIY